MRSWLPSQSCICVLVYKVLFYQGKGAGRCSLLIDDNAQASRSRNSLWMYALLVSSFSSVSSQIASTDRSGRSCCAPNCTDMVPEMPNSYYISGTPG